MTRTKRKRVSRLDYCQYLLTSQTNYTMTHFADHVEDHSHDEIQRYLRHDHLAPRLVWENVRDQVIMSERGILIFDDVVLDKRHAKMIGLARPQWSGNAKGVVEGIGVVTCVYVNPELDKFWVIDYRIYAPQTDHKSKLDHMREMLQNAVQHKKLELSKVLMDSWYAARDEMLFIEGQGKTYFCPVKDNRLVQTLGQSNFQHANELLWTADELRTGQLVHLKDFPLGHAVRLFRIDFSTEKREYIVTNDVTQDWTPATQEVWHWRSKIEEFHREAKQVTGMGKCQARLDRIVRNHIACAMLVWVRLKFVAAQAGRTIYQIKQGMLSNYLRCELRSPSVKMCLAA